VRFRRIQHQTGKLRVQIGKVGYEKAQTIFCVPKKSTSE